MGLERVGTFPLLDHDEGVGAELGLERTHALGVDRGAVLDAALLGTHRRHVGAEVAEDLVPLAGLGGDDGDDVDHAFCSTCTARLATSPLFFSPYAFMCADAP